MNVHLVRSQRRLSRRTSALVAGLTALVGVVVVLTIFAAEPPAAFEPELGTVSGAAAVAANPNASGGKMVTFGGPEAANTSPLAFTMPSQAALKASPKLVFGHYFTPYPIQLTNVPADSDYYAANYLNPTGGSEPKSAAYGGLLRDRPLPQPVGPASWQLDNMKTEVRRATTAGLDGFTIDVLGTSGYNWDRLKLLIQAAPLVDPSFKIVLMPDQNGSGVGTGPAAFAASIASIANSPGVYHLPDGRLVVAPFGAEGANGSGLTFYTSFIDIMKNQYGIEVALVPCFLDFQGNAAAFAPISYGFSNWGNRSPADNTNIKSLIDSAHARGKIWMQPVSLQDSRPNQGTYRESNNTENFRTTWAGAAQGADWVQIPTWNDYSENAHITPSAHLGWSALDINAYYLTMFKTGASPVINNDVIYVSHRIQAAAALPTAAETLLMTLRGSSPARDKVEVLAFLTAPGTIEATVGGVTQQVAAPAGVSVHLFDLKTGSVSARALRGGAAVASVVSPFPVVDRPVVQDLQYHFVSSGRAGGIGSWDD